MTRINIAEFYLKAKSDHEQTAAAQDKLNARLRDLEAQASQLDRDLREKKSLMERANAEGLDTGPLSDKARELLKQIDAVSAERDALKKQVGSVPPPTKAGTDPKKSNLDLKLECAAILAGLGCTEATVIHENHEWTKRSHGGIDLAGRSLGGLLGLGVTCESFDSDGRGVRNNGTVDSIRAVSITVWPDRQSPVQLPLGEKPSFVVPKELAWLTAVPMARQEERGRHGGQAPPEGCPELAAFLNAETGELMLSRHPDRIQDYQQRNALTSGTSVVKRTQNDEDEWRREVIRTDAFAEAEVAALFARNPFPANSERLQSDAVLATIKSEWAGIVLAPWSEEVKGPLALLKDQLTRGDAPRFWSTGTKGHFGYRVRSGAYVWLLGKVFIDPFMSEADARSQFVAYSGSLARSGRMWLSVREELASELRDVVRVIHQD